MRGLVWGPICKFTYIHIYVRVYEYMGIYVYIYICIYVCVFVNMYIHSIALTVSAACARVELGAV